MESSSKRTKRKPYWFPKVFRCPCLAGVGMSALYLRGLFFGSLSLSLICFCRFLEDKWTGDVLAGHKVPFQVYAAATPTPTRPSGEDSTKTLERDTCKISSPSWGGGNKQRRVCVCVCVRALRVRRRLLPLLLPRPPPWAQCYCQPAQCQLATI